MKHWTLWMLAGVLSLAAGFIALANPFAATLVAELMIGSMFVAIGILTILSALSEVSWGGRLLGFGFGLLTIALGASLVTDPLRGILELTFLAALLLVVLGALRILVAFLPAAAILRWPLVASGMLSIVLGILIFRNYPEASLVTLGLFLAIELLSNGVSLIALSFDRRRQADA
jgi:uncharacterized membrane protein HdeD (DUF308 family)